MATIAQIQANRLNSQKSTGPRTPQGKEKVSQNSTRHGLSGRHVLLPGEDPAEYEALRESLHEEWNPAPGTEHFLVEQLAQSEWRLLRIAEMETRMLTANPATLEPGSDPLELATGCFLAHSSCPRDPFAKLIRYESTVRRAYDRALSQLIRLQKLRSNAEAAELRRQREQAAANARQRRQSADALSNYMDTVLGDAAFSPMEPPDGAPDKTNPICPAPEDAPPDF